MRTAGCSCRCDPGQVLLRTSHVPLEQARTRQMIVHQAPVALAPRPPDTQQGTQANSGVEAPTIGLGASPAAGETEPSPALSQPDESFLNGVFLVAGQNYVCELVHARLPVGM